MEEGPPSPPEASGIVLTIAAAKDAGYYESREFARDDYYSEDGQAPGRWVGREAAALRLADAPERGDFETLLSGHDPADGSRLAGRFRTLPENEQSQRKEIDEQLGGTIHQGNPDGMAGNKVG